MLGFIFDCCKGTSLRDSIVGILSSSMYKTPNHIYRDELDKKKPSSSSSSSSGKLIKRGEEGKGCFARRRRSCHGSCTAVKDPKLGQPAAVRVKVLMTKEEAAQLLSKCKDGGVLEFRDAAGEIAKLPMNRIYVSSLVTPRNSPVALEAIVEEV